MNPTFQPFILNSADVDGVFGRFIISVWDSDRDGANDLLGSYTTTLYELVAFGAFQYPLYGEGIPMNEGFGRGKSAGAFCVDTIEPIEATQLPPPPLGFFITAEIKNMKRQDGLLGKADPWFAVLAKTSVKSPSRVDRLARALGWHEHVSVYKSEVHKKTLTPKFKKFPVMLSEVGNDMDAEFGSITSQFLL